MRVRKVIVVLAAAVSAAAATSACGDAVSGTGTSLDSGGINQTITGTPCIQRGIIPGDVGTTTCNFNSGATVLTFNNTDGVRLTGDPAQLPSNCTLGQGAQWNNGVLTGGGITCTWMGTAVGYTPGEGVKVTIASSGPLPTVS